jgi:hypothetical protein
LQSDVSDDSTSCLERRDLQHWFGQNGCIFKIQL